MGYKLAIYPSLPHKVAVAAMKTTYEYLQKHGTAIGLPLPLATSPEMHALMGFEDVWAFEKSCTRFEEPAASPER
jgi:2-methylisocitrate lyase-like PEP mutase family enzyme